MKVLVLCVLLLYHAALLKTLNTASFSFPDSPYILETESFRAMKLGPSAAGQEDIDCEELAFLMIEHEFDLSGLKRLPAVSLRIPIQNRLLFLKLADGYRTVFSDLKCFPIPQSADPAIPDVTYADSWNAPRTYGGERSHEGCDLMGAEMPAGFYPVISMTEGVIEKAGWLEQGGYRVGVRSPSGAYFYYAHLDRYADGMKEGAAVHAGELLGFMGSTGYGAEGTSGQFPVHLHVGIYLKTEHYDELSVNPYWILKFLEKKRTCILYGPETVVLFPGF